MADGTRNNNTGRVEYRGVLTMDVKYTMYADDEIKGLSLIVFFYLKTCLLDIVQRTA